MPSVWVRSPDKACYIRCKTWLSTLETVYLPRLDNRVNVDPFALYAVGCQPADGLGRDLKSMILDLEGIFVSLQNYRMCTKQYLAEGKDGYIALKGCPVLVRHFLLPSL